jgi:hypothetical protein
LTVADSRVSEEPGTRAAIEPEMSKTASIRELMCTPPHALSSATASGSAGRAAGGYAAFRIPVPAGMPVGASPRGVRRPWPVIAAAPAAASSARSSAVAPSRPGPVVSVAYG